MGKHLSEAARKAKAKAAAAARRFKALKRRYQVASVAGIAAIIVISLVAANWNAIQQWGQSVLNPDGDGTPPPASAVFSIVDPFNLGVPMDARDFTLTVMMHDEGTSTTNAANWHASGDVADTRDLTPAFFAAARLSGYDAFYGIIAGAVVNTAHTFDDAYGDRTYGSRQFAIVETGMTIYVYVTPSGGASFTIANLNTGAAITTANISASAGTNFSVTMFLNNRSIGAYDQCYVSYTNYVGTVIDVNVLATFTNATGGTGATVASTDLAASGMTTTAPAYNQLAFHTGYLGQAPVTNNYLWDPAAIALAEGVIVSPNSLGLVLRVGTVGV